MSSTLEDIKQASQIPQPSDRQKERRCSMPQACHENKRKTSIIVAAESYVCSLEKRMACHSVATVYCNVLEVVKAGVAPFEVYARVPLPRSSFGRCSRLDSLWGKRQLLIPGRLSRKAAFIAARLHHIVLLYIQYRS